MPRKSTPMLNLERYISKSTQTKSVSIKLSMASHTALIQFAELTARSIEELLALLTDDLILPFVNGMLVRQSEKDKVAAESTSTIQSKAEITSATAASLATFRPVSPDLAVTPSITQPLIQPLAAPSAAPSIKPQSLPTGLASTAPTAGNTQPRREPFNTPSTLPASLGVPASPTPPKGNPSENG